MRPRLIAFLTFLAPSAAHAHDAGFCHAHPDGIVLAVALVGAVVYTAVTSRKVRS